MLVVLVVASPVFPSKNNFVKALRKEHPEITSIVLNINDKKTSMILGERNIVLYGKGYIQDELCGYTSGFLHIPFISQSGADRTVIQESESDWQT